MGKMIECIIDSIRVSLTNQDRITVLKEKDAERYLPIWMGVPETDSITIALQGVAIARPLTHDLLISIMNALDIRLESVEVTNLENDTFYANLILDQNGVRKIIDSRPSDAIALAIRAKAPVFVDEDILDAVGIRPEDVLPQSEHDEVSSEFDSDLDIFEDFLGQLGKDNPNKDPSDDPSNEDPNQ
jgi:bifunctional DNase/RNase